MSKRICIVSVFVAVLALVSSSTAWADSPGKVTGGIQISTASGMHGWMRFDVHASGSGGSATGWVRWQEYTEADGWRRVVAHPLCASFGVNGGAPAAVIVVQLDSVSGWGDGVAGQYLALWVRDGGRPGWNGDKFTTLGWPPGNTIPDCGYSDAGFFFATVDAGNLVIHP